MKSEIPLGRHPIFKASYGYLRVSPIMYTPLTMVPQFGQRIFSTLALDYGCTNFMPHYSIFARYANILLKKFKYVLLRRSRDNLRKEMRRKMVISVILVIVLLD